MPSRTSSVAAQLLSLATPLTEGQSRERAEIDEGETLPTPVPAMPLPALCGRPHIVRANCDAATLVAAPPGPFGPLE